MTASWRLTATSLLVDTKIGNVSQKKIVVLKKKEKRLVLAGLFYKLHFPS